MSARFTAYVLLLIVSIIWGVAAPIIKFTLNDFPPLIFLAYRFAISSVVAVFAFSLHKPHLPAKTSGLFHVVLYGFLTSTVSLGLLFLGFDKTTALTGVLISAVGPVFVTLAGILFFHDRVTTIERIGIGIAFLGTLFTIIEPIFGGDGYQLAASIEGNLLVVASLLLGVILAIQSKLLLRDQSDPATLTHVSFLIGFFTIVPVMLWYHSMTQVITVVLKAPLSAHLGVWYMALLSGTVAYTLWHKGQKSIEVSEAAVFGYLMPIWAMPLSILWLGEKVTTGFLIGASIIAVGVIIAEHKQKSSKKATRRKKR